MSLPMNIWANDVSLRELLGTVFSQFTL